MKYREVFLVVFLVSAITICLYCSVRSVVRAVTDSRTMQIKAVAEEKTKQVQNRTKRFPWARNGK